MRIPLLVLTLSSAAALLLSACAVNFASKQGSSVTASHKKIVATHSMLGSIAKELVSNKAEVITLIPNGQDMHSWEPSAKDIETLYQADLILQNGLGLEANIIKTIQQAEKNGVKVFTATDHIEVRKVGEGEHAEDTHHDEALGEQEDHHHEAGAPDPHFWTDPIAMKKVASALASTLQKDLNLDVFQEETTLRSKFDQLHQEIHQQVGKIPADQRKIVSGHESLGYFAERYGFELIGAIIPSITTQAEVSAADIAALKKQIQNHHVKAVFSELGTPKQLSETIARETGAQVIELNTHILPPDGSYFTFMRDLTQTIVKGLQ